jgi:hypothetical protein
MVAGLATKVRLIIFISLYCLFWCGGGALVRSAAGCFTLVHLFYGKTQEKIPLMDGFLSAKFKAFSSGEGLE